MVGPTIRFVHAGDFHLEQPPHGLAEIPRHLRDLLLDCPYRAAERVFETAWQESADFLVLAGDIVDVRTAGPRGVVFLREQFERLAERGVAVYWAGGRSDGPAHWPAIASLPDNVYRFPTDSIELRQHVRRGEAVAAIVGASRGTHRLRLKQFPADPTGLFTVGVYHAKATAEALAEQQVHYLALGGKHTRDILAGAPRTAIYAGTPQGRAPEDAGPHGCTIVDVDDAGHARTRQISVDAVRWVTERVVLDEPLSRTGLEKLLHTHTEAAIEAAGDRQLMISWRIAGPRAALAQLKHATLGGELLAALRAEHGQKVPGAWSVALSFEPPDQLPDPWYQQDTILGDFLRLARDYQQDDRLPLELESLLSERHLAGTVAATVALGDPEARQRILNQAVLLGADLLGADLPGLPGESAIGPLAPEQQELPR